MWGIIVKMYSKKILDVRVDFDINMDGVLDVIENDLLKDDKNHIVCTTNPEFIVDAQEDDEFKKIINNSSLSVPDGIGVVLAKNFLNKIESFRGNFLYPIKVFFYGLWLGISSILLGKNMKDERVTGVDITHKICELSSKKGYTIFFLGGRRKNALGKLEDRDDRDMSNMAADEMRKKYPGVNIVGATSDFNRGPEDDDRTVSYIRNIMVEKGLNRIDFLFVAYNHRYQEKWIIRNKDKISAKVSIGCGGTFDFIVGNCTLPPELYVRNNLGWLYRLIKQPWRVKRILKAFPTFPMKVFVDAVSKKR